MCDGRGYPEAKAVAHSPDHGPRHHIESRECAVAARKVNQSPRALQAGRPAGSARSTAAAAPGPTPAWLAGGQVDRDQVMLTLGDDGELGQSGQVNDGAGNRAACARSDVCSQDDLAAGEIVHEETAVVGEASDAAGGNDARAASDFRPPEHATVDAVEGPHLGGSADNEPIAAEVRPAQVDSRDNRAPARRVAQASGGYRRRWRRPRVVERRGVRAVRFGREVDLSVGLVRLAKRVAGFA